MIKRIASWGWLQLRRCFWLLWKPIAPVRCNHCYKPISREELVHYGFSCESCEKADMKRLKQ